MLIAGDLFHRQPLLRELKEVNSLFETLLNTQVVLSAGNHDYLKKDSYYRTFKWAGNVHMILSGDISCVELPGLSAAVYGLSYHAKEIGECKFDCAVPEGRQKYEILLAHGGDEKHIPIQKEKLCGLGYDYVALGHIHKPQILTGGRWSPPENKDAAGSADITRSRQCAGGAGDAGSVYESRMAYSGALEPIDKNDTGKHGCMMGELTDEGCRLWFIPCAAREYVNLEVTAEKKMTSHALKNQIRGRIREMGIQNIYRVTVRGFHDPDILFDFEDMDPYGNITDLVDETKPAYDFPRLLAQNPGDLLGRFIESLMDYDEDSVEYLALCEGVQAMMETRKSV